MPLPSTECCCCFPAEREAIAGQITTFDAVLLLIISEAVQQALIDGDVLEQARGLRGVQSAEQIRYAILERSAGSP